jgi:hypothetical protein
MLKTNNIITIIFIVIIIIVVIGIIIYSKYNNTNTITSDPITTQTPFIVPTTTQTPVIVPTTTQTPVIVPTTTQKPFIVPTTTQTPVIVPTTTQTPVIVPTNSPTQSYNYNILSIEPLVGRITIKPSSNNSLIAIPLELNISQVIITDQNGNIITPTNVKNVVGHQIYTSNASVMNNKVSGINSNVSSYTITIPPSQVKNIKIIGSSLSRFKLILSNSDQIGRITSNISIPLTNAPSQSYTYSNKLLTMDTTPIISESFTTVNKMLSSLDKFYLPLHIKK